MTEVLGVVRFALVLPRDKLLFDPDMRHAGLWVQGDTLYVFWTRVGDAHESVLVSEVDLSLQDWNDWRATQPQELLRPELPWEGSELNAQPSLRGELNLAANEMRAPFVFESGKQAIGLARLRAVNSMPRAQ